MVFNSIAKRLGKWLIVASLLGFGLAMAQSEPSLNQIYATAQAGRLDQAQVMVQQVLVAHPNSAKAFYVQAELSARQGKFAQARDSLATAERLSPGLPFAKPEAAQALRSEIAGRLSGGQGALVQRAAPATQNSGTNWMLPLLLAGGVIVLGYFVFRRREPAAYGPQPVYDNGLNGPQSFGAGGGMQPAYPQAPGYPPQPGYYPQQQGTGLGGRIVGGVATGLAVGAGVMAAEAIGRNLMGHREQYPGQFDNAGNNFQVGDANADMGGANFGVTDGGSWDDGGGATGGGWDN